MTTAVVDLKNVSNNHGLNRSRFREMTTTVMLPGGLHRVTVTDFILNGVADDIQAKAFDIWCQIPRGCAIVQIDDVNSEAMMYRQVLVGLRKFNYDHHPPAYILKHHQLANDSDKGFRPEKTCIVVTEKVDGECFHITAWIHPETDEIFWIGGSKHVHGVVRDTQFKEDIDAWVRAKDRYSHMFPEFMERFRRLGYATRALAEYLAANSFVMCGESCNPERQHMFKFTEEKIYFYAVTRAVPTHKGLTGLPMMDNSPSGLPSCWEIFRRFNLPAVAHRVYSPDETPEAINAVYNRVEQSKVSEGAVVYYVCPDTGLTWHVFKLKGNEYNVLRVIRESIKVNDSDEEIYRKLMGLKGLCSNIDTGLKIARYVRQRASAVPVDERGMFIHHQWVPMMEEFARLTSEQLDALQPTGAVATTKRVFVCVGIPGMGKSTVCEVLSRLLPRSQIISAQVRESHGKTLHKMLQNPGISNIFIDKTHAAPGMRKQYKKNMDEFNSSMRVQWFVLNWTTPEQIDMFDLATKRIQKRGFAHPNLFPSFKLESILDNFSKMYVAPQPEEFPAATFISVPAHESSMFQIETILSELALPDPETLMSQAVEILEEHAGVLQNKYPLDRGWISLQFDAHFTSVIRDAFMTSMPYRDGWLPYLQKEFHVSVCYQNAEVAQEWLDMIRLGTPVVVHLDNLAFNGACCAFNVTLVGKIPPHDRPVPHITLATMPGHVPNEANDMFQDETIVFIPVSVSPLLARAVFSTID